MKHLLVAAAVTAGVWLATPTWADPFFFSTGSPDGLLGALSQPANSETLETETADDFILTETTSIAQATITGLIPSGTPLANVSNVEIEVYHRFPKDSDVGRTSGAPMFSTAQVPTRVNSPSDVEIDDATRDGGLGTLEFTRSLLNSSFSVANTVVKGINPNTTRGVQRRAMWSRSPSPSPPRSFCRRTTTSSVPRSRWPKTASFLYLSAPRPIKAPGIRSPETCKPEFATRTWRRTGCESEPTSSAAHPSAHVQYDIFTEW